MELNDFVAQWTEDPAQVKDVFVELKALLETMDDTQIQFNARPGITYSMRGMKASETKRPLFVMVDVIDDDPSDRWLSVCFYGDLITDPEELGDIVPGGLLGEDGHCFDVEGPEIKDYVIARVKEARASLG
ncbi:MAG: hypothetical protein CL942_06480 [Desulfovibrio sp.]|nr:hypothetical protein [Desulfovibrio sp.]|tara:strand:- start:52295 stop:52687 length:393 start_codon:yes stop_codon:yes gene_type:complete